MRFKLDIVRKSVLLALGLGSCVAYATEFNIDVLDAEDVKSVDISQFSVAGYVPPGHYVLTVFVNGQRLGAPRDISVYDAKDNPEEDSAAQKICIPSGVIDLLGLKIDAKEKVTTTHNGECLDLSELAGFNAKVELSTLSLKITMPQMWMEYRDPNWPSPALWEDGINGAFIDYSANASFTDENEGSKRTYLSTNGTSGINIGAWRFRGDYSATYQKQGGDKYSRENHNYDLTRLYAFTSLKTISSILAAGENYFYSDIFESWQYTGISLESDDRMLPPKLVGYAPEIIGVADTNATVTVRSKERVILETTVPPGPFRIQTLDSGVRGILSVTIREENGKEKRFSLSTASLPYLTRPGRFIYKLAAGKTRYDGHKTTGYPVASGEFSYGITNAWSLYGGSQLNDDYQSLAVGIGRDLFSFGALALDITQSYAHLFNESIQGRSYRLNYAKSFDDIRADINFAGYRFADRDYRTLTQFMDQNRTGYIGYAPKENYQIYINKYFENFNASLQYQYSTYWQDKPQTQYGLYASTNISIPWLSQQSTNVSLSATRTKRDNGYKDDAINLYLTIPLYNGNSITYSDQYSRSAGGNRYNHSLGYNGYSDRDNYSLNVGYSHGKVIKDESSMSGYYSRDFSNANISASAGYVPQQYRSIGASINSGITATSRGIALHRSANGDTRLMIETPAASGVPLDNGVIKTNAFGLAVIPNVNSYRKTTASINTSKLPDNLETLESSTEVTLTKGAIGYRSLSVLKGEKAFAVLKLGNGEAPPFGASVRNSDNRELGIVGEDGVTWLVGISPKERLSVYWSNIKQCQLVLPEELNTLTDMLLLPCLK